MKLGYILSVLGGVVDAVPIWNESEALLGISRDSDLVKRAKPFELRILSLGASIVRGIGSTDGNGFRKYVRDQLRYEGWAVNMVGSQRDGSMTDNDFEATPGFTVAQLEGLAENSFKYKPNVVLIHAGTNDMRSADNGDTAVSTFGLRVRSLVDKLFEQPGFDKSTIIVSTLIPLKEPAGSKRASMNAQIRAEVTRYRGLSKAVVLAEMVPNGQDWIRENQDFNDNIHPNNGGHKRMASIFWKAVREAEAGGFLKPADPVDTSNTCDKVYGEGVFAGQTQKGSGEDDGIYTHSSQSMGTVMTIESNWDRKQWFFARLFNKDRDDIVGWFDISITESRYGTWRNTGATTNTFVKLPNDLNTGLNCVPAGIWFIDLNADGLDDFICVNSDGSTNAAINNGDGTTSSPPTFRSIGSIRSATAGYDQSRVRWGDVDGDGRADYCLLEGNGDINCWRNGGWGDAPAYWQALGKRFTGKGMGDLRGVRFEDINGDGRDDWLWVGDSGEVHTYTNSRSCLRGELGDGLNIEWRAATTNPIHSGMNVPGIRDRINFARIFSDASDIGLQRRLDYVFLDHTTLSNGKHQFAVKVFRNTGSGATKIKADGNKYCNMKGWTNGRSDYVWTYNNGRMVLYPNKGLLYVSSAESFWDASSTIWDPTTQSIARPLHRRDLHLLDYDGDGKCDIVWTDPDNNYRMSVWLNRYSQSTGQFSWTYLSNPAPQVTCDQKTGLGFRDLAVRFADVSGNGRADYLCLEKDGRTKGYIHNADDTWEWIDQFKKTEDKDRANLRFNDVNGDGKADMIHIDKFTGDGTVWYNRGRRDISGSRFEWFNAGKAFKGNYAGTCSYYADLDGNQRADFHEVTSSLDNTAVTWLNVCASVGIGQDDADGVHNPGLEIPPGGVPG
ncbi:hypothetical protein QBC38DRAFT_62431 [Podospora fimiseda]|uniref:SGNH hydrolase-type esterase domain-containing protein n=1 Tax=Podospora fimiseda TaxID=252190 RepID=A0AAN7BUW1_9PEZI|nr:hypothetical protein QBC38DRAFT_62431 [Podospora fimiseda]